MPESEVSKIKTKLRNTCGKYSNLKVLYRHRKIVLALSKNENIVILKQENNNVQRSLRKLKSKLSSYEYKKLYPTGSCPGKFYGTAKLHKLPVNGKIDDLPIRPIVSNINTAIYQLVKHLSKALFPLRELERNIKITKASFGK